MNKEEEFIKAFINYFETLKPIIGKTYMFNVQIKFISDKECEIYSPTLIDASDI
jgi:hypothetical protein